MDKFDVYTDGAVSGNPGPGGAAAIIYDFIKGEITSVGYFNKETTNQRMELQGIILALSEILNDYSFYNNSFYLIPINIYSDSNYCVRAFNEGWIENWQRNDWKNAKKEPVANQDLWKQLLDLISSCEYHKLDVNFIKVKGHSNNKFNNAADELAVYCKKRQNGFYEKRKIGE